MPFTMSARASTLIIARQDILPSCRMDMMASLSPALMPAFSLTSLGSTIWPRSSTLTTPSTLQQLPTPPSDSPQTAFLASFAILTPLLFSLYSTHLIVLIHQHILIPQPCQAR